MSQENVEILREMFLRLQRPWGVGGQRCLRPPAGTGVRTGRGQRGGPRSSGAGGI